MTVVTWCYRRFLHQKEHSILSEGTGSRILMFSPRYNYVHFCSRNNCDGNALRVHYNAQYKTPFLNFPQMTAECILLYRLQTTQ